VDVVDAPTKGVVIEKETAVWPAAIVTELGTPTPNRLELKVTVTPPSGAGLPSTTVPVADVPPITDDGLIERLNVGAGVIVSADVTVTPP